jgi:hypothetical protein
LFTFVAFFSFLTRRALPAFWTDGAWRALRTKRPNGTFYALSALGSGFTAFTLSALFASGALFTAFAFSSCGSG